MSDQPAQDADSSLESAADLQQALENARQTIHAQQLAYRAIVEDYQHCANQLVDAQATIELLRDALLLARLQGSKADRDRIINEALYGTGESARNT